MRIPQKIGIIRVLTKKPVNANLDRKVLLKKCGEHLTPSGKPFDFKKVTKNRQNIINKPDSHHKYGIAKPVVEDGMNVNYTAIIYRERGGDKDELFWQQANKFAQEVSTMEELYPDMIDAIRIYPMKNEMVYTVSQDNQYYGCMLYKVYTFNNDTYIGEICVHKISKKQ